jgi:hypothetical protein
MTAKWNDCWMLLAAILVAGAAVPAPAQAQQPGGATAAASVTVFQNVRIFDGKSDRLSEPSNVTRAGQQDRADFGPARSNRSPG